jgi:hypothetical protein
MTTEIEIMKHELTIAKQDKEILELKLKLEQTQIQKASRLEDSLFSPNLYQHYYKIAELLAKSEMVPKNYIGKPSDIFVSMAMGYQLGFPVEQALQDIAVINGRPCLWGDGLLSLCLGHPDCESIKEEPIYKGDEVIGYSCTIKRKGYEPHTTTFTQQDAATAGLLKKQGPWTQYPARMMQMRARSYAIRDKFADALRGLRIAEIEQDIDEPRVIEHAEPIKEETQTQRLKKAIKKQKENIEVMAEPETESIDQQQSVQSMDDKITNETLDKLYILMDERGFTPERTKKALEYFKVDFFEQLTNAQADIFMAQLQKAGA